MLLPHGAALVVVVPSLIFVLLPLQIRGEFVITTFERRAAAGYDDAKKGGDEKKKTYLTT